MMAYSTFIESFFILHLLVFDICTCNAVHPILIYHCPQSNSCYHLCLLPFGSVRRFAPCTSAVGHCRSPVSLAGYSPPPYTHTSPSRLTIAAAARAPRPCRPLHLGAPQTPTPLSRQCMPAPLREHHRNPPAPPLHPCRAALAPSAAAGAGEENVAKGMIF